MTPDERQRALEVIGQEVRACTACRLHQGRTNAVPGEGSAETEVVFVGEGPGFNEDQQGRPFVGAAGSLLTELLRSIGWRRDEVFITNVVKCRPPGNRDPEPDEIAACAPYLRRQLEVLDPAVVVTLGRFSLQAFMPGARIAATHGTVRHADPATGAADADAFALYHPAAAFRQASLRETLFEDISRLPEALIASRDRRSRRSAQADAAPADAPAPADSPAPTDTPAATHNPAVAPAAPAASPATIIPAPLPEPVAVGGPNDEPIPDELAHAEAALPSPDEPQLRLF